VGFLDMNLALSQVDRGIPERVTKRHLYIMEDMYRYIVTTCDRSAVYVA